MAAQGGWTFDPPNQNVVPETNGRRPMRLFLSAVLLLAAAPVLAQNDCAAGLTLEDGD